MTYDAVGPRPDPGRWDAAGRYPEWVGEPGQTEIVVRAIPGAYDYSYDTASAFGNARQEGGWPERDTSLYRYAGPLSRRADEGDAPLGSLPNLTYDPGPATLRLFRPPDEGEADEPTVVAEPD
jgi:hypothetical protein